MLQDNIPDIPLSVEIRRNIYLTVRECLHNIVKHAKATKVDIEINRTGPILKISVKDNGEGFDYQHITNPGNGLINMKKRIQEIGGEFELNSRAGQGTTITLILKV